MNDQPIPADHRALVEALLFAADRPLSSAELADLAAASALMDAPWDEAHADAVARAIQAARDSDPSSGIELVRVAGGWELRTRPVFADALRALVRKKPARLGRAALEVLAIVAWRQPCTRADIDDIRGVDSSAALRPLVDRGLIRILGKSDDVGRPLVYGTTPAFLALFGLDRLDELPSLRDDAELTEESLVQVQALEDTLRANEADSAARNHDEPGAPPGEPPWK